MRVRINALPKNKFAAGGYANTGTTRGYGMQQDHNSYALNRFWSSPAGYPGATSKVDPYKKVGTTLPEAADGGDINAEKQERVLGDFDQDGSLELMNVNGPSHAEGGKNVDVPSHSFVFSDTKDLKIKDPAILAQFGITTMKRGGFTPADIAKKYDLNKYKKVTDNPESDDYAMKTAQLMSDSYLAKLNKLAQIQEEMKKHMGMEHHDPNQPQVAKHGGMYQVAGIYPPTPVPKHGSDWMPFDPDIAAAQGYTGEPSTLSYQKWANMHGAGLKEDNLMGAKTINWHNPDAPIAPLPIAGPVDANLGSVDNDPYFKLTPYTPTNVTPPPTAAPPVVDELKKKGTQGGDEKLHGIGWSPNFYGNLQNVLQMATLRKFKPWEQTPQAVVPDTVFLDPTRAIAAQQEEARSGSEMDQRGDEHVARAVALLRQGVAGKQAADTIGQYHNQNVGIANQANREAAAITNQLMERQANRLAELNKANFLSDRDYQREMGRLQSEFTDRMQRQHDINVKTAWLNKTSPYFDIDPVTQMPRFKPGNAKAKYEQMYTGSGTGSSGSGLANLPALYNQALAQIPAGVKDREEKAYEIAYDQSGLREHGRVTAGPYGQPMRRTYSGVPVDPMAGMGYGYNMQMPMMSNGYYRMGGKYQVGGSFLPLASGPDMPMPVPQVDHTAHQMPMEQSMQMDRKMSKADIATLTKNPGNMKYASWMSNIGGHPSGIPGQDGGEFAAFPDFQTGMHAYKEQLFGDTDGIFKSNYYKPHTTVDQALKTWSNNGYDGSIYPAVKNKTLAELTPQERDELARRQIKAESSSTYSLLRQRGVLKNGGSVLQKFIR